MNNKPLISVIIPVYNVESYLEECLDSLRDQSLTDFEVVLVDDGSTDMSGSICDAAEAADSRFRTFHCDNGGSSVARNYGIKKSRGRYAAFVDSDDVASPDYLARLYELQQSHDADIAMVRFTRGISLDRRKFRLSHDAPMTVDGEKALELTLYQHGLDSSPCCKLFKRELFEHAMFKPGLLYEDLELIARILPYCRKVTASRDVLYFYRQRPGSNISKFSMKRLDVLDVTRQIEERAETDEIAAAARDRRFSANYNMLMLLEKNGLGRSEEAQKCRAVIDRLKKEVALNRKSRLKNRVGALVASLGRRAITLAIKLKR